MNRSSNQAEKIQGKLKKRKQKTKKERGKLELSKEKILFINKMLLALPNLYKIDIVLILKLLM